MWWLQQRRAQKPTGTANKAAQIVLNLPTRSHRNSMYDKLKWLTVNQLEVYDTLLSVYRIRTNEEPEYLASIVCWRGEIIVKNNKLELVRKRFLFRGATQ